MADFTIKTGDTAPPLEQTLLDYARNPVDINGATVEFIMRHFQGETVALAGETFNDQTGDASLGFVRYEWGDGDLDVAGPYEAEWQVTFANAEVETFPNDRYVQILLVADIEVSS